MKYLRKNGFHKNCFDYYKTQKILNTLKIKIESQLINSYHNSIGLMIKQNGKDLMIPISKSSIIPNIDEIYDYPCDNLPTLNEAYYFYYNSYNFSMGS